MPPRINSRYTFCSGLVDEDERLFLSAREPFRYRALPDNIVYRVAGGDTLWALADRYYQGLTRPAGFWWVIADFQPEPIFDPTIALQPGQTLIIPSLQTVSTLIFSEDRRDEETV